MSFPNDTGRARVELILQPHGGAIVPAWRLFVTACLIMIGASSAPVGATPPPQPSSPFIQGQTDRQGWESWFGALTGDYRDGAWYWSGQRSLPNPGSCNAAPPFAGGDWTAGCFAAQQKLAPSDARRKTEPDYRFGWNNPEVSSGAQPTASDLQPGIAPPPPQGVSNSNRERANFGHHAGESAIVISKEGVGTTNAHIQILLDWDREVWACAEDYLNYPGHEKDQKGYLECLKYAQTNFRGPSTPSARANCQTGEMFGFGSTASRFYAGQIRHMSEETADHKSEAYYTDVFTYEGFQVPDAGYTGVWEDGEIFRKLCPISFLGPPQTMLPELNVSMDCQQALGRASDLVTEAGVSHVLNFKIIDAWDVQNKETTWNSSKCTAKVMFNNGRNATLEYENVPRHGKYFLSARIAP